MKKSLLPVMFLIFITTGCGTRLTCCNSMEDVKVALSGIWEKLDEPSESQFEYWFENDEGGLTELQYLESEDEYVMVDDETKVELVKSGNKYKIQHISADGPWISNIEFLDSKNLTLKTDGKIVHYVKTKI